MGQYQELRNRQKEEVNAFPLHWAFTKQIFESEMKSMGLDPEKDLDKVCTGPAGCFLLKEDAPKLKEMLERHSREREEAVRADATGDGYIYEMFLTELKNCEYGYTGETGDALNAAGFTQEEVEADPRLKHGLQKAMDKIQGEEW